MVKENEVNKVADITLSSTGEAIIPKDEILLVDADTIVVLTVLEVQQMIEVLPKDCYTDEEWIEIQNNPTFDGTKYFDYDFKHLKEVFKIRLETIMENAGTNKAKLHFTLGRDSFRYKIYPKYKEGRDERAIKYGAEISSLALRELKEDIIANPKDYGNIIAYGHTLVEADDIVVYLKEHNPDKYILCAIDKDVLYSVPGKHFNYYTSSKWNIPMQWVEVQQKDVINWFGCQCIAGDSTDNIPGLAGYGPKKIAQYLADDTLKGIKISKLHKALEYIPSYTMDAMWDKVVTLFEQVGLTREDALLNARLVSCRQIAEINYTTDNKIIPKIRLFGEDKYYEYN